MWWVMTEEYKAMIRLLETDIKGDLPAVEGISRIRGVGPSVARAILHNLGIPLNKRIGFMTDDEIKRIEEAIKDIANIVPPYMVNRRFDRYTGKDIHLIGADLKFMVDRDIEYEKNINSWRGIRHKLGLKVRGQRTRTTGRRHKKLVVKRRR